MEKSKFTSWEKDGNGKKIFKKLRNKYERRKIREYIRREYYDEENTNLG